MVIISIISIINRTMETFQNAVSPKPFVRFLPNWTCLFYTFVKVICSRTIESRV